MKDLFILLIYHYRNIIALDCCATKDTGMLLKRIIELITGKKMDIGFADKYLEDDDYLGANYILPRRLVQDCYRTVDYVTFTSICALIEGYETEVGLVKVIEKLEL